MRSWVNVLGALILPLTVSVLFAISLPSMTVDTDINHVLPLSDKQKDIATYLDELEVLDRYTVIISFRDSNELEKAKRVAEQVADSLLSGPQDSLFAYIQYAAGDDKIDQLYQLAHDFLPLFLDAHDYQSIDSTLRYGRMQQVLERQYHALLSPAGMVTKKYFIQDPLGWSTMALKKFGQGFDQDVTLDEGFFVSASRKDLIFFVKARAPKHDDVANKAVYRLLNRVLQDKMGREQLTAQTYIYGGALVALENSEQVRKDTGVTVWATLAVIILLVVLAFRNAWSPLLLILPVVFSAVSALLVVFWIKGALSGIAIGAGAVVLGIAIDFCIHFYCHYLESGSLQESRKEIFFPLLTGGITTSAAFFSLLFTESQLLQDLGLFAGLAILFAFFYTVTLMPVLIRIFRPRTDSRVFEQANRWLAFEPKWGKPVTVIFVLLTALLGYFAGQVRFDSDLSHLAYRSEEVERAEHKLNEVSGGDSKYLYFLARQSTSGSALHHAAHLSERIDSLTGQPAKGLVRLLVTEKEGAQKYKQWKLFWQEGNRLELLRSNLNTLCDEMGIRRKAFEGLETWILSASDVSVSQANQEIAGTFLSDYNRSSGEQDKALIIPYKASPAQKELLIKGFENDEQVWIIDRQSLVNTLAEVLNRDFQYVLTVSSLLVLLVLFHLFGRLELALLTFTPMLVSWVWILGIMGWGNIPFNIVNIILCTFIFGLGDDFSIFMTEAKLNGYKYGRQQLGTFRFAILLSSLTTLAGMAALFGARHPAIHSIALVSVVGICCVTLIAFFLIPALFDGFITRRVRNKRFPITLLDLIKSVYLYALFLLGALVLNALLLVFRILFVHRRKTVRLWMNHLIMYTTRGLVYAIFFMRKNFQLPDRETLRKPSIVIANHRSFIDIVILTMLKPRIVLVAADWVWKVPVLGPVLECGGYIRASMPAEEQLLLFKQRLEEGYSVVIFPEGTRNTEEGIKRFHKGAFFLAEECQADILPLLIHGSGDCITKGDDFVVKSGTVSIRTLPVIPYEDTRYGHTYQERTKQVRRYMESHYMALKEEREQPRYFRRRLLKNYLYKGAVLEWYLWVKIRLERDYEVFHTHLPAQGKLLDLGCGYGFMAYLLNMIRPERHITGVDYDEGKIAVAQRSVLCNERLHFIHADVNAFQLEQYDGIVISDVLHYLPLEQQKELIRRSIKHLNPNGVLMIRDADIRKAKSHWVTRWTEVFSTRLLKFNKTGANQLEFVPLAEILSDISQEFPVRFEAVGRQKHTSNVVFCVRKKA